MAQLKDFMALNEDAKWLAVTLLTEVDDSVWTSGEPGALNMTIAIEGVEIQNLDGFLNRFMEAFREEVKREAAEIIVDRYEQIDSDYHEMLTSARQSLNQHLSAAFGVNLDEESY